MEYTSAQKNSMTNMKISSCFRNNLMIMNKNLVNIIFSYLNKLEQIKIIYINKRFRDTNIFSLKFLKHFKFLHKLCKDDINDEIYLNRWMGHSILTISGSKFDEVTTEEQRILAYVFLLLGYYEIFGLKKIEINF